MAIGGLCEGWLKYLGRGLGYNGSSGAGVSMGCGRSCRSLSKESNPAIISSWNVILHPTVKMKLRSYKIELHGWSHGS